MTHRDKKMVKILCVLGPVLLIAAWYAISTVQAANTRKAERREKARLQAQQAASPAASPDAPTPPAGSATTAAPAAPSPTATKIESTPTGIRTLVDADAQNQRMLLAWGRDPFVPPDTQGPQIQTPGGKLESPRGLNTLDVRIQISDAANGNSGIQSALLYYGPAEPFDQNCVQGVKPPAENGDGEWTFSVPVPQEQPVTCYVTATDNGRLKSQSRSALFQVLPVARESVETQIGGTGVKLTLRGISWSGGAGVALINNNVCSEGDVVLGCEVVEIAKNGVTLKHNDQRIFLQLKE